MIRRALFTLTLAAIASSAFAAPPAAVAYKKVTLSRDFYAEGAYFGDFNRDGKMDVVIGPFWFEGPDFQKALRRMEIPYDYKDRGQLEKEVPNEYVFFKTFLEKMGVKPE